MEIERISVSRINAFEQCPLYYDAIYNKGMRLEKDYFTFGTIIHEVLELYHGGESDNIEELLDVVWRRYNLTDIQYYYDGLDIIREYKLRPEYHQEVLKDAEGKPYLERYFNIPLDGEGQVVASGVIDRIDKIDQNTIEVIDYKTSRIPHTREEMKQDRQLSMYNIAVNNLIPEYSNVLLSLLFLRHDKLTTDRDEVELEDTRHYFINLYYQIKLTDDPKPRLNKYCGGCPIRSTCSEYKNITQEQKMLLGELPESLSDVWEQLEDVKEKQKIFNDRRAELEEIIKTHIEVADKDHLIIGDKKVYMAGQKRSFYPYRLAERVLGAAKAKQFANISKEKVLAAVGDDEKKQKELERGKITYYTKASINSTSL